MYICSTIYRVQWSHQFPHIFSPTAANRTCTQHLSEHLAENAHFFHRVVIISPIVRIATNWVHTPFSDSNPHKSQDHSMRAEADTQGMFVLPCCAEVASLGQLGAWLSGDGGGAGFTKKPMEILATQDLPENRALQESNMTIGKPCK